MNLLYSLLCHGPKLLLYPGAFEQRPRVLLTPSQFGLPYEDVVITTSDNVKIRAYLLVQKNIEKTAEPSNNPLENESEEEFASTKPTILMFHGNADNIGFVIPLAEKFFVDMHCNVLMLSPRGYGLSEGRPSTKGLKLDSKAALHYIVAHPILAKTPIILYGQSMGAAFAIDLGTRNHSQIRGLIVENTFTSLRRLIPDAMPIFSLLATFFRQWNSLKRISETPLSLPILMLSGLRDEIIPARHMKALWDAANPNGLQRQGRLVEFAHGHHNDTWDQPGYWEAVAQFVEELTSSAVPTIS
ncbi:alpha/beta-hydrolase [Rickenella mellea]|uniref:Alpha/beta-hydrolase n=1 Tax=Rickenella mellea TaxID=50990 RepID=A0A4Y7QLB3_9AGAM|nr:alpha/beta-hydrolase [Rickenella mellea]